MACEHVAEIDKTLLHEAAKISYLKGCAECVKAGTRWVHLRECLVCGHVGCCDSSPGKHATKHNHATEHPVMRSVEPGEKWGWCYVDQEMLAV